MNSSLWKILDSNLLPLLVTLTCFLTACTMCKKSKKLPYGQPIRSSTTTTSSSMVKSKNLKSKLELKNDDYNCKNIPIPSPSGRLPLRNYGRKGGPKEDTTQEFSEEIDMVQDQKGEKTSELATEKRVKSSSKKTNMVHVHVPDVEKSEKKKKSEKGITVVSKEVLYEGEEDVVKEQSETVTEPYSELLIRL